MLHLSAPALILGATALLAQPSFADDTWYYEFDAAAEAAAESGKDLLVDFTGSDWCGWCHRLDDEVFAHQAFLDGVADKYVLVKLDFPRSEEAKAKVPNPERNAELRDAHNVRGYPTILLVTAEGQAFAQTGYQAGGPEAYLEHLGEIHRTGRATLERIGEVVDTFEKAEGKAKLTALGAVLDLLGDQQPGSPFINTLVPHASAAFTLDADNRAGLKLRAVEALLSIGTMDERCEAAAKELDPKNEKGLLERVVGAKMQSIGSLEDVTGWVAMAVAFDAEHKFVDTELQTDVYINIAFFSDRYVEDGDAQAQKYAKKALELMPEDHGARPMIEELANGADEEEEPEDAGTR
jgi:thiol-disulfide isomerase/thioredoxin